MHTTMVNRGNGDWEIAPGTVFSADDLVGSASLIVLTKDVADVLERHYPGWVWAVQPDEGGGVLNLWSVKISAKVVWTLHLSTIQNDPDRRCVIRAGGEYLERFGFRRGAYTYAEWKRREQSLGQFIPDVSDMEAATRRQFHGAHLKQALETGHAAITMDPSIGHALRAASRV